MLCVASLAIYNPGRVRTDFHNAQRSQNCVIETLGSDKVRHGDRDMIEQWVIVLCRLQISPIVNAEVIEATKSGHDEKYMV